MPALWPTMTWSLIAVAALLAGLAIFCDPARGRLRCPGGWKRVWIALPWRAGCWYDMRGVVEAGGSPASDAAMPDELLVAPPSPQPSPHSAKPEWGEGGRCPECGRVWKKRSALQRRRVRWRGVVLGAFVAFLAWPASLMPRVERFGAWSVCPTWALVLFAPVDEFCKGALGCPFSWPTMPEATTELLFPKWDRPYAPWETAILKRRLEAGVERVRAPFVGRDALFLESASYGSEQWWGWEGGRFTDYERRQLVTNILAVTMSTMRPEVGGVAGGSSLANTAPPNTFRLSPSGLIVLSTWEGGTTLWPLALSAFERATPEGALLWPSGTLAGSTPMEVRAYDVGDLCAPMVSRRAAPGAGETPGRPVIPLEFDQLVRAIRALDEDLYPHPLVGPGPSLEESAVIGGARSTIFVRQTPEAHAHALALLGAIRGVWADPTGVSAAFDAGGLDRRAMVLNVGGLRAGGGTGDPLTESQRVARRLDQRLRDGAEVYAVGDVVVVIGMDADHLAARQDVAWMRAVRAMREGDR